jgi:hypothetical protein
MDQQALVQGTQYWLVLSVAAVLPILWSFTLALHFARPYVIRYLQGLTLRFGGDVWWLSYVLMRDALMVMTLALSAIFLFPNLYMSQPTWRADHGPARGSGAVLGAAGEGDRRLGRRPDHLPDRLGSAGRGVDALHHSADLRRGGRRPGGLAEQLLHHARRHSQRRSSSGPNPALLRRSSTSACSASPRPVRSSSSGSCARPSSSRRRLRRHDLLTPAGRRPIPSVRKKVTQP